MEQPEAMTAVEREVLGLARTQTRFAELLEKLATACVAGGRANLALLTAVDELLTDHPRANEIKGELALAVQSSAEQQKAFAEIAAALGMKQ